MTNPHIIVASTRRSWLPEQKRAILAEADDPATTASAVACRHGLHSSLLFRWRRAVLAEQQARTPSAPPTFVPLALPLPAIAAAERPAGSGVVEIELAGGHRLRAEAGADLTLLQDVIAALLHRWAGGYAIMMHGPEGAVWQAAVNGVALITIALSIVTVVDLTLAAFRLTPLQGNQPPGG